MVEKRGIIGFSLHSDRSYHSNRCIYRAGLSRIKAVNLLVVATTFLFNDAVVEHVDDSNSEIIGLPIRSLDRLT